MPIGMNKSKAGLGGAVPQVNLTGHTRIVKKRLFFSRRESALLLEKTLRGGYGHVDIGTVMAVVTDTNGDTRIVPYVSVASGSAIGKSLLVTNHGTGTDTVVVSLSDSYRFQVADTIALYDPANARGLARTIAAITRGATTATITLNAVTNNNYTVADGSFICLRTGDAAQTDIRLLLSTTETSLYILDQDIYTGEGEEAIALNGALGSVVTSNAVLYRDVIENLDSSTANEMTLLNLTVDGLFYIMR
jgi:PHD/YefM family antitoxin component YafN of YafNO toxin-antitoxin module